jgi:hypothetical protein
VLAARADNPSVGRRIVVTIETPVLRAATVAYADFSERVKSEAHATPQVGELLRDEASYFVEVWKIPDAYEVNFIPRAPRGIQEFRGGGVQYLIDDKTYAIRAAERMK